MKETLIIPEDHPGWEDVWKKVQRIGESEKRKKNTT